MSVIEKEADKVKGGRVRHCATLQKCFCPGMLPRKHREIGEWREEAMIDYKIIFKEFRYKLVK